MKLVYIVTNRRVKRGAKWVKEATEKNFSGGIKTPVKLWNRCVEVEGDYV
jgi:hypothetical protein